MGKNTPLPRDQRDWLWEQERRREHERWLRERKTRQSGREAKEGGKS